MKSPGDYQTFVNIANQYLEKAAGPAETLDHHTNTTGTSPAPMEAQEQAQQALNHFQTANSTADINVMFPAVCDARSCLREAKNIIREVHPDNSHNQDAFEGEYDAELEELIDRLDGRLRNVEQAIEPIHTSGRF